MVSLDLLVVKNASRLRQQYSFSFWDSLIIASALEAGVTLLYSEDMQDGILVAGTLEIINPFKENEVVFGAVWNPWHGVTVADIILVNYC